MAVQRQFTSAALVLSKGSRHPGSATRAWTAGVNIHLSCLSVKELCFRLSITLNFLANLASEFISKRAQNTEIMDSLIL